MERFPFNFTNTKRNAKTMSKRCKLSYKNKLYKKVCIKHSRLISSTNTIIVKIQQTRIVSTRTKNGEFFMCTIPLSYVLDSQENREFVLKNIDI